MRIRIHEKVLMTELQDEAVLLDLRTSCYFALNPVAARAFAMLAKDASLEDVFASLLKEFDVAPEVLRADLDAFINELLSAGLASQTEDPPPGGAP